LCARHRSANSASSSRSAETARLPVTPMRMTTIGDAGSADVLATREGDGVRVKGAGCNCCCCGGSGGGRTCCAASRGDDGGEWISNRCVVLVAASTDGNGERPRWTCCPAAVALGVAGRDAVDAGTVKLLLASRSSTGRAVIAVLRVKA
jgi:hypothetical protein